MAKSRRILSSRHFQSTPYHFDARQRRNLKRTLATERKEYDEATCSVCMEFPHNAVLLLCSSHDNGCRPYMCGTGHRHSNCLDQFSKACTKVRLTVDITMFPGTVWNAGDLPQVPELACPLCRGQVKGWTVVESARKYLNSKKRSCVQDGCSFAGKYKELERHVKSEHPHAKPPEVDPLMVERWRMLEYESERRDAMSSLTSSMSESTAFGGHGFEMNNGDEDEARRSGGILGLGLDILYVWRESNRLLRLRSGIAAGESRDFDHPVDGIDVVADISVAYSSAGDGSTAATAGGRGRALDILRARRRSRRRRRIRELLLFDGN